MFELCIIIIYFLIAYYKFRWHYDYSLKEFKALKEEIDIKFKRDSIPEWTARKELLKIKDWLFEDACLTAIISIFWPLNFIKFIIDTPYKMTVNIIEKKKINHLKSITTQTVDDEIDMLSQEIDELIASVDKKRL